MTLLLQGQDRASGDRGRCTGQGAGGCRTVRMQGVHCKHSLPPHLPGADALRAARAAPQNPNPALASRGPSCAPPPRATHSPRAPAFGVSFAVSKPSPSSQVPVNTPPALLGTFIFSTYRKQQVRTVCLFAIKLPLQQQQQQQRGGCVTAQAAASFGPPPRYARAAVPLGVLSSATSRGSLGGGIFRSDGSTCQMSRAYSLMVRSLENLPAAAMFLITFLVHALEFCERGTGMEVAPAGTWPQSLSPTPSCGWGGAPRARPLPRDEMRCAGLREPLGMQGERPDRTVHRVAPRNLAPVAGPCAGPAPGWFPSWHSPGTAR